MEVLEIATVHNSFSAAGKYSYAMEAHILTLNMCAELICKPLFAVSYWHQTAV